MPPTAKVTHIILKKPNGVILSKLPVSDTMTGSDRQLSVNYDMTTEVCLSSARNFTLFFNMQFLINTDILFAGILCKH